MTLVRGKRGFALLHPYCGADLPRAGGRAGPAPRDSRAHSTRFDSTEVTVIESLDYERRRHRSRPDTLGNLIAGLSLVLYRPFKVGDDVQLNTPKGLATATVELISLGYTMLRDGDQHEILVPNSVMMSSIVIRLNEKPREPGSAGG